MIMYFETGMPSLPSVRYRILSTSYEVVLGYTSTGIYEVPGNAGTYAIDIDDSLYGGKYISWETNTTPNYTGLELIPIHTTVSISNDNIIRSENVTEVSQKLQTNRRKFENILKRYGHTIYLQRICTVSEPVGPYHKHPENCSGCSGKGYEQVHEKHLARKDVVTAQTGLPASLYKTDVGMLLAEGTYFYFMHFVNPKEGDRIFEWDTANNKWALFEVAKAMEERFSGGGILYWVAPAKFLELQA